MTASETAKLAAASLGPADFDRRMSALGYLSVPVRSSILGVSERTVQGYQEGRPIPRFVGKLLTALEEIVELRRTVRALNRTIGSLNGYP